VPSTAVFPNLESSFQPAISPQVSTAKMEVAAAENEVAAAKMEVAAAENEVAAAKMEVAAAKMEVAAVESKVTRLRNENLAESNYPNDYDRRMFEFALRGLDAAITVLDAALIGLKSSQEYLAHKRTVAISLEVASSRPPLHPTSQNRYQERTLSTSNRSSIERATPYLSPSQFGHEELERLKASGKFERFKGRNSQKAVLSIEQQQQLDETRSEQSVVAYLTPCFEEIIGKHNLCVVNSEMHPWLQTSDHSTKFRQKPDLFFSHRAFFSSRPPPDLRGDQMSEKCGGLRQYGVLSHWVLRENISVVGEARIKINTSAFGEVLNYGCHLCWQSRDIRDSPPVEGKLILFDKSEFWLVKMEKGIVTHVTISSWTDEGSRTHLENFLPPPNEWIELLNGACDYFDLVIDNDSFLGHGSFGRVFQVHRKDDTSKSKPLALKLVLTRGNMGVLWQLLRERDSLKNAKLKCPNYVIGVEGDYFSPSQIGGCLLLSCVGNKVNPDLYFRAITSLAFLHQNDVVHGDARLDNVVSYRGDLLWIDFRADIKDSTDLRLKVKDMRTLIGSLLYPYRMSEMIEFRVDTYDTTPKSVTAIIDAYREYLTVI
jgi:hypothetical protein